MVYSLKYGSHLQHISAGYNTTYLGVEPPEYRIDRQSFTNNLSKLIKPGAKSAGIVVSDKTRLCSYNIFLPWVTGVLRKKMPAKAIKIYIAYGTHPRQTEEESLNTYGDTYNEYEFIHHDCDSNEIMTLIGITGRGTKIKIRKDILEHDQIILFGSISHHYFAGYGGGRKLLFPGLAEREAISCNHKLFIDFDNMRLRQGCRSGKLKGNPVAEDLYEIDKMMPEKIIISGIPDASGNISRLNTGTAYKDFLRACSLYDKYYRTGKNLIFDTVIAGTGGYPKDINFIQSHKSMHNAASFVRDGGNLFLLAECRDGIGNDSFLNIFNGSKQEIYKNLKKNYSGNGGTALSLISKTERINIHIISKLSREICNKLNIRKLSIQELNKSLNGSKGSTAVIDNASVLYR